MADKHASSQAAWALLTEGVTSARLNAHQLQHLLNRAQKLVDGSDYKEHFYQEAGDIIVSSPKRLEVLINDLDRTALALSKMGEVFLRARLPVTDKTKVEDAVEPAFGGGRQRYSDPAQRVADRWIRAKLQGK